MSKVADEQAVVPKVKMKVASHFSDLVIQNNNTNTGCIIQAVNDIEAVSVWLNEYITSPATYKAYQKEAERFLLWCYKALNKSFSQLNREDFDTYVVFLKDPQPREDWCTLKEVNTINEVQHNGSHLLAH